MLNRYGAGFSPVRRKTLITILQCATESDASRKVEHEIILDMVFGAIGYRLISGHAPLDRRFQKELLNAINILLKTA